MTKESTHLTSPDATVSGANPDSPREKLRVVRERYLRNLPWYLNRIEETWSRLMTNRADRDGLRTMQGMLHTLSGSAPTFGLAALGETARRADSLLRSILEDAGSTSDEVWQQIGALLEGLGHNYGSSEPEESAVNRYRDEVPESPVTRNNSKLVFIVEDDVSLLQNLAVQIECFGYVVHTFPGLAEVRTAVARTTPSAIIMDLMFPEGGIAGAQAIAEIQSESGEHVPVIFISQRDDFTARLEAVRAGGDAYLTKPIHISRLIDKLDALTEDQEEDPYRILIIDDDPELAHFYALTLQQYGMVTRVVNDPSKVIQHLVEFSPELILMDMYMDGCRGDELAMIIRQMEAYVSIPIVYLSAETRKDRQLRAMGIGADDFLTKPIKPEHLISSVVIRAERMRIIRSFMEQDSLTGLLNHSKTKEQLNLAVLRARRSRGCFSFAMLDIDEFKSINDTYGHLTGDRVIVLLSRLLQQRLRKTDIIGRYGGEEFAVILMDTPIEQAFRVMDEIRHTFEQVRHESDLGDFFVTFSCGIASFPRLHDPVTITREADRALYEAKTEGRNRVIVRQHGPHNPSECMTWLTIAE
ncbi:diguanylate cyclase [bacterium]|nr:diguanylate cyclase [bacterium]